MQKLVCHRISCQWKVPTVGKSLASQWEQHAMQLVQRLCLMDVHCGCARMPQTQITNVCLRGATTARLQCLQALVAGALNARGEITMTPPTVKIVVITLFLG